MSQFRKCECDDLPDVFNIKTYSHGLMNHIELVESSTWLTLQRCVACRQLWQLDNVDQLQVNLAIKVDSIVEWKDFDDKSARFQHLIDSRGGVSEKICIMEGCKRKALKSLAHCPFHAFDYVGLRE